MLYVFYVYIFFILFEVSISFRTGALTQGKKTRRLTVASGPVTRAVSVLQARILLHTGTPSSLQTALTRTQEVRGSIKCVVRLHFYFITVVHTSTTNMYRNYEYTDWTSFINWKKSNTSIISSVLFVVHFNTLGENFKNMFTL